MSNFIKLSDLEPKKKPKQKREKTATGGYISQKAIAATYKQIFDDAAYPKLDIKIDATAKSNLTAYNMLSDFGKNRQFYTPTIMDTKIS